MKADYNIIGRNSDCRFRQKDGNPERRQSGKTAIRKDGNPERRQSGKTAIRKDGNPERRQSGKTAIRKDGNPERQQSRKTAIWKEGMILEEKKEQKAVCTIGLIVVNIGVFLIFTLLGKSEDVLFMQQYGAMYEPYVMEGHEYYRLLTSIFLHFGIEHLLNNMVMLGALGYHLEPEIGKVRFLLAYLLSGIGGNICSLIVNVSLGEVVVSAGASGAVFGLMGALLCAVIRNKGRIGRLNKRGVLVLVVLSVYLGFSSSGVDNAAHVGGLVCGFLLEMILGLLRKSVKTA